MIVQIMAFSSDTEFRVMTGSPWSDNVSARIAAYQMWAVVTPIKPEQFLQDSRLLLKLVQYEPEFQAKHALLDILDERVRVGQACNPQAPRPVFFEQLMAVAAFHDDGPIASKFIDLGLDALSRGWHIYPKFFDWAAQRITHLSQNVVMGKVERPVDDDRYPRKSSVNRIVESAKKMADLRIQDPSLLCESYVDMCSMIITMRLTHDPIPERVNQPHRRSRLERDRRELNEAIGRAHLQGVLGLSGAVKLVDASMGQIDAGALFSKQSLRLMTLSISQNKTEVIAVVMPGLFSQIEALIKAARIRSVMRPPAMRFLAIAAPGPGGDTRRV